MHFCLKQYHADLFLWFKNNGRHNLPWQVDFNVYHTWLSEIMLQQTQVKTVIPYFENFIRCFPDIESIANAPVNDILMRWSGLGYYSRARNLHKSANIIMRDHEGMFPGNVKDVYALPGIGKSTAHAILSIAKKQALPILEGNVKRVLARLFMINDIYTKSSMDFMWKVAYQVMPSCNTQAYTQLQMDLGALICTRRKPKWVICVL